MASRWTTAEENRYREELYELYVRQNKTIGEIGNLLGRHEKTIYDRLLRLGIPTARDQKPKACNRRKDVRLPDYSPDLAEFIGIMLGDGCLTHFQAMVTLGTKEYDYVVYVQGLMQKLFNVQATVMTNRKSGHHIVYIGSTAITSWLQDMGLVFNKVAAQVGVPKWVFEKEEYMQRFLRGFFDTDGSVYALRFGIQLSFTNHSLPLLHALHSMLETLEYRPSKISAWRIYVTRRDQVARFFQEVRPQNVKHQRRLDNFERRWWSGKHTTL